MTKKISLLGSTGSIGRNVLEVVRRFPGRFSVVGLAAGKNVALLRDQISAFNPQAISVADHEAAAALRQSLPVPLRERVFSGQEGNKAVASLAEADIVVSAMVGAAGLIPTLTALEAGKDVALANKETLVMAGELIIRTARRKKKCLLPIDSEHSAIFQALEAGRRDDVAKIILTASGGPFRNMEMRQMWDVTPEQALAHPNWNMGRKISIDSATLMNKGLEVIEAKWLFDIDLEDIEVLIHPQSIVHSMVEFIDGSFIAQMGIPDMQIPIAYALSYPERLKLGLPRLDLTRQRGLEFYPPDFDRFPALALAYKACKQGGAMPAVLNAANELAVEAFLQEKIRFPEISLVVSETLSRSPQREIKDAATILEVDLAARMQAESIIDALEMKRKLRRGQDISLPTSPQPTKIP